MRRARPWSRKWHWHCPLNWYRPPRRPMRTAEAERAKITGNAGIRTLPHAAEHCAARELRFLALRVVHAAEHFAGERIERLPRAGDGLVEHGDDERIGDRAAYRAPLPPPADFVSAPLWQIRSRYWPCRHLSCRHQFRHLCHRLLCRRHPFPPPVSPPPGSPLPPPLVTSVSVTLLAV